jgi:hypothetical protein
MSIGPAQHRFYQAPASRRWIALLIASVLLHLIVLDWFSGNISMPEARDQTPTTIDAKLYKPQQSALAVPPKPKAKSPKPAPRAARPVPPSPVAAAQAEAALPARSMETPAVNLAQIGEAFLALENGIPASGVQTSELAANEAPASELAAGETDSAAPAKPDLQHYKISIPPSAELKYDVQALRNGQMVYGSGKISWQSDGGNYTVNGEASILFFTLLNFKSTGVIDDFGVAPVIYSEKRFRRSETNTHFHRERNTISFSASTATYPRKGGEQDRASIVWQLTGIGRGDGEKFQPGAEIDFFVAGVRDAEPWRIRVIGEEQIEIGSGKVTAWHVVRIPKQGSYDQKLDIWFAPQHEWYPVKLRFTDTNGEYLDMLLSNLTTVAAN